MNKFSSWCVLIWFFLFFYFYRLHLRFFEMRQWDRRRVCNDEMYREKKKKPCTQAVHTFMDLLGESVTGRFVNPTAFTYLQPSQNIQDGYDPGEKSYIELTFRCFTPWIYVCTWWLAYAHFQRLSTAAVTVDVSSVYL